MSRHADAPLCPHCGEDDRNLVTATRDGRRVVWHCSCCGKSWLPTETTVTGTASDVSGVPIFDP